MSKRPRHGDDASDTASDPLGLINAAEELSLEVRRFEQLTSAATRGSLDSEKAMEHAIASLQEAAASHRHFGDTLRVLIEAITVARERQNASADALNTRTEEIQSRRSAFDELQRRFASLGEEAAKINALVQTAAGATRGDDTQLKPGETLAKLEDASARMESVIEIARQLGVDARAQQVVDIERQADSIRQQVQSARNKLDQVRRSFS